MKKGLIILCLLPLFVYGQEQTTLDPKALKESQPLWTSFDKHDTIMPAGWADYPVITLSEAHRVDIQDKKRFNPLRLLFHFRNEHQTEIAFTDHYLLKINTAEGTKTDFPVRHTTIEHGEQIPSTHQYTFALRIHKNGVTGRPTNVYAIRGASLPERVNLPPLKSGDMVEYVIHYEEKTNDIMITLHIPAQDLCPKAHYTYDARVGKKLRSRIFTPQEMSPQTREDHHQYLLHLSRESITDNDTNQTIKMQTFNVFESRFIGIHLNQGMSVNHQLNDLHNQPHPFGKKYFDNLITPMESLRKQYDIQRPELYVDPNLTPSEKAKRIALYCRDLNDVGALPKYEELSLLAGLLKEHHIAFHLAFTSLYPEKELEDADQNGRLWFVRIDHDGTCLFPMRLPSISVYGPGEKQIRELESVRADQVPPEYVGKRAVTQDFNRYFIIEPNK